MKKLLAILLAGIMVFSFAACGKDKEDKKDGGTQAEKAVSAFEGEWIGVAGDAYGFPMDSEELAKYAMKIEGNKATLTTDGESMEAKCKEEGNKITLTIDSLEITFDGTLADGAITFEDYMGFGLKLILAKEGTAAADPSLYIPEADKAMVGTWASYAVTDILDEDISDVVPADALVMNFKSDYTVDIALGEENIDGETWTLYDGYGYLADSEYDFSWDVVDDEIEVSYYDGEEYYIFLCQKTA